MSSPKEPLNRREFIKVSWLVVAAFFALRIPDVRAARSEVGVGVGSGSELGENADSPEVQWIKASQLFKEFFPEGDFNFDFSILPSSVEGDSRITTTDTLVAATIRTLAKDSRPSQQFLIVRGRSGTVTDLRQLAIEIMTVSKYQETTVAPIDASEIRRILAVYYLASQNPLIDLIEHPHAYVQVQSARDPENFITIHSPQASELFPLQSELNDAGEPTSFVTKEPLEIIFEVLEGNKVAIPLTVQNVYPRQLQVEFDVDQLLTLINGCTLTAASAQPQNAFQAVTTSFQWQDFFPLSAQNAVLATAQVQSSQPEATKLPQTTPEGGTPTTNPGCSFFVGSALAAFLGSISSELHAELTGAVPHRYAKDKFHTS